MQYQESLFFLNRTANIGASMLFGGVSGSCAADISSIGYIMILPITPWEAALGSEIRIPTPRWFAARVDAVLIGLAYTFVFLLKSTLILSTSHVEKSSWLLRGAGKADSLSLAGWWTLLVSAPVLLFLLLFALLDG